MQIEFDERAGKSVGSRIRLAGRVFRLMLSVEEIVTEREPPFRKTWETVGVPKLLVIGSYRLGFIVAPASGGSTLRVLIDYDLPQRGVSRLVGRLLSKFYARWCVGQMVRDAVAHFAAASGKGDVGGRRSAT